MEKAAEKGQKVKAIYSLTFLLFFASLSKI
jgi:hypothetical protein